MTKKKNVVLGETKQVVKTGIVSMGGMAAVGALAPIAGPAAGVIVPVVGAGVGLANIGQMLHSGGKIVKEIVPTTKQKGKQDPIIKKILG